MIFVITHLNLFKNQKLSKMKKLILAFIVTFGVISLNAQSTGPTMFSIGVEGSVPVGIFHTLGYNFGIGGSVQVEHKISSNTGLTLNIGYITYSNNSTTPTYHFNVIPLMGGVKYWFSPKVYIHGQLGAAFNSVGYSGSNSATSTGFAYSPGIGFLISNNLDLLIKYFGNSVSGGSFNSFGARLALSFGGR